MYKNRWREILLHFTKINLSLQNLEIRKLFYYIPHEYFFFFSEYSALVNGFVIAGKGCITMTFAASYVYTAEVVPTEVRNIVIGFVSSVSHVSRDTNVCTLQHRKVYLHNGINLNKSVAMPPRKQSKPSKME